MPAESVIPPTHRAIRAYHDQLSRYGRQTDQEGGLSMAFFQLLADTARSRRWTAVYQQEMKVGGKLLKPDATLRDEWRLPHGYWEAKDTHDDLDAEIRKKFAAGYPQTNIIFEDTRQAVLIQNGEQAYRAAFGRRRVGELDLRSCVRFLDAYGSHRAWAIQLLNEAENQSSDG